MTSTDSHVDTIREVIDESLSDVGIDSERVVLFGSQARGDYTEESGVDILIVSPDFEGPRQSRMYRPDQSTQLLQEHLQQGRSRG